MTNDGNGVKIQHHDDAVRITFVLTGGTLCSLTFCEHCASEIRDKLPDIWRKCVSANASEAKEEHSDFLIAMARQIPLGELYRETWREVRGEAIG